MKATQIFLLLFIGCAVGCAIWLGFFRDTHQFGRELSQEEREAKAVGALPLPSSPIKISIQNKKNDCHVIESAELEGKDLLVYWRNACAETLEHTTIRVNALAPDGTLLTSSWTYISDPGPNQRVETKYQMRYSWEEPDPRISVIQVKIRYNDGE